MFCANLKSAAAVTFLSDTLYFEIKSRNDGNTFGVKQLKDGVAFPNKEQILIHGCGKGVFWETVASVPPAILHKLLYILPSLSFTETMIGNSLLITRFHCLS